MTSFLDKGLRMKNIQVAVIVSIALIICSSILNIGGIHSLITMSETNTDKNILIVDGGKIRLGKVNSERERLNILIYMNSNDTPLFNVASTSVEGLKNYSLKDEKPIIDIENMPPEDALNEFNKQLSDFVALINKEKSDSEKITTEQLISKNGFAVRVSSEILYNSELAGKFPLSIDEKISTVDSKTPLFGAVASTIREVAKETADAHKANTFM